jgi:hypothetical protein
MTKLSALCVAVFEKRQAINALWSDTNAGISHFHAGEANQARPNNRVHLRNSAVADYAHRDGGEFP